MDSQLLYQQDPTILEFEATVVEVHSLPGGRQGVILDQTYFYPTGGGQEHDEGRIGSARVVDVFKNEKNARLEHVVEGQVELGKVHAVIDPERRLRHMQHHTAQHLLTQCLVRQTGFETVSANINGYTPSTLDIIAPQISKEEVDQAEKMANQLIYENRPVKAYFVTPEELKTIPLRRPPKVHDNIRIVEIDSFDYSPCGGTHVLQTGSIGLLKVLKAEKQNDKQRIFFIAGLQAMQVFNNMYDAFIGLANQFSTAWQDLPALVNRQAEQLADLQKDLRELHLLSTRNEAFELANNGEAIGGIKLVRKSFEHRTPNELRQLADELRKMPDIISFLVTYDGQKLSLVVTCGDASGKDARQLLNRQLAFINGRGGGDARLAQGGGSATMDMYQTFLDRVDID
jgi:alanyl-tRNA synthetase